jgi:hypothetical protein
VHGCRGSNWNGHQRSLFWMIRVRTHDKNTSRIHLGSFLLLVVVVALAPAVERPFERRNGQFSTYMSENIRDISQSGDDTFHAADYDSCMTQ